MFDKALKKLNENESERSELKTGLLLENEEIEKLILLLKNDLEKYQQQVNDICIMNVSD